MTKCQAVRTGSVESHFIDGYQHYIGNSNNCRRLAGTAGESARTIHAPSSVTCAYRPHMHTRCTTDARLRHARTSTTRLRPGATNAHRHAPPMSCRLSILDPRRCCLALLLLLGAVAEQCCTAPKSQLTPTTWCGFSTCEGARSRAMRAVIVCSEGKAQPGHRLARPRRLGQSKHKKRQRSVVQERAAACSLREHLP